MSDASMSGLHGRELVLLSICLGDFTLVCVTVHCRLHMLRGTLRSVFCKLFARIASLKRLQGLFQLLEVGRRPAAQRLHAHVSCKVMQTAENPRDDAVCSSDVLISSWPFRRHMRPCQDKPSRALWLHAARAHHLSAPSSPTSRQPAN